MENRKLTYFEKNMIKNLIFLRAIGSTCTFNDDVQFYSE